MDELKRLVFTKDIFEDILKARGMDLVSGRLYEDLGDDSAVDFDLMRVLETFQYLYCTAPKRSRSTGTRLFASAFAAFRRQQALGLSTEDLRKIWGTFAPPLLCVLLLPPIDDSPPHARHRAAIGSIRDNTRQCRRSTLY